MTSLRSIRRIYGWAILAGFVWALAFPNWSLAGAAWIAPGMMLFIARGSNWRQAFRFGYVAGLAHHLTALYWLLFIPFPAGAVAGWLALSAYLSLFPAVWLAVSVVLSPSDLMRSDSAALGRLSGGGYFKRQIWALTVAAVWVALELIRARFLTGFPWNLLGVSQFKIPILIQIASVTGVYGVSFLIVWFSASLAMAVRSLANAPMPRLLWLREVLPALIVVVVVGAAGARILSETPAPSRTVRLALVQPSIPQTLIWDPTQDEYRFDKLTDLSRRALENDERPQVLIWPEASTGSMVRYDKLARETVTGLARTNDVWLILGADDAERRTETPAPDDWNFYNASFLISNDGTFEGRYTKRRLVIFGEFIPFAKYAPFLKRFLPIGDGFKSGDAPVPFEIPEFGMTTSVLICFEDNFPHLAREYVEADTDFLLNLTNNGWFGESAAQWQHCANAVLRTVENRIPLVRGTNNGLSCWIDSRGQLHAVEYPGFDSIYAAGVKIIDVPLLGEGREREFTFYTRHGDVFAWSCVGWSLGALAVWRIRMGTKR